MVEALKTWRKHNAAMLLATQSDHDFVDTDLLRAVIENCPTKFFLANPGIDLAHTCERFHLTDREARRIADLRPASSCCSSVRTSRRSCRCTSIRRRTRSTPTDPCTTQRRRRTANERRSCESWRPRSPSCCGSPAHAQGTRDVSYTDRAIVSVQAKLRFTTLIILPEGERILDFVCGDKDFWIVSGVDNLAYVKPAKAGASTNLNLITDQRPRLLVPPDRGRR